MQPLLAAAVHGCETGGAAAALTRWSAPLGWLVCRCDSLRDGQLCLLQSIEGLLADLRPELIADAAPLLKAIWEAQLCSEALLQEWAAAPPSAAGGRRVRQYAQPLLSWIQTAEIEEIEEGVAQLATQADAVETQPSDGV